ncbi:MAG: N-acetyl sugar amidotransferase [Eubacteriales bacterium]|nr:N-acetyl sugar amidotransferase [Eubacteriales bacterium]
MAELHRCTRCVMDDASDSTIRFDEAGHCDYCTKALAEKDSVYFPNEEGKRRLSELVARIKREGEGKPYDCIMGLSGGLDSSYLLYLGYKLGLRILGVHIDDGFDTEISRQNLLKLVKRTDIDYVVVAPDPEQFYGLSKAYMKAGVANLAAPQDNILFAEIYALMRRKGIKYFLSGGNWALECILQRGNTHTAMDTVNMRDINRRFGETRLDRLKLWTAWQRVWDQVGRGIQSPRPLNYIDYNRDRAFAELKDFCGFEYYGRKHLENIFTAFVQLVWFPRKFGVDKRTSHLSSMIVSGQMTRDEALSQLAEPMYDEAMMAEYIRIIKEKLRMSDAEYEAIMAAPAHEHTEYRTDPLLPLARRLRGR